MAIEGNSTHTKKEIPTNASCSGSSPRARSCRLCSRALFLAGHATAETPTKPTQPHVAFVTGCRHAGDTHTHTHTHSSTRDTQTDRQAERHRSATIFSPRGKTRQRDEAASRAKPGALTHRVALQRSAPATKVFRALQDARFREKALLKTAFEHDAERCESWDCVVP